MRPFYKKVVPPILISSFIALSALLGFTQILGQRNSLTKYREWMKDVDDNTSLREMNIPGTHDTMALYNLANVAGKCQSLSLNDQLNLGVRFLDIRLKLVNNKLMAYHAYVDQKCSFETVVKVCETFLKKYPSETLLMSVKEDDEPSKSDISFENALKKHIDPYWITNDAIPSKLGDIRGRIVLLSRYSNPTIGLNMSVGWRDSDSFTLSNHDIYIQDTYKVTNSETKKNEIVRCFNEEGHDLKINFLSAYNTEYFPPSYAPSVANDINPWINKEISKYQDRGIVLYDFVTESLMKGFFKA